MKKERTEKQKQAQFTKENAKENGRKGGIKSGVARRKTRSLKKVFDDVLAMPMKDGETATAMDIKAYADFKGKNITMETALALAMIKNALKGDVRAAEFIRDTSGQKPASDLNIDATPIVLIDDIKDDK